MIHTLLTKFIYLYYFYNLIFQNIILINLYNLIYLWYIFLTKFIYLDYLYSHSLYLSFKILFYFFVPFSKRDNNKINRNQTYAFLTLFILFYLLLL